MADDTALIDAMARAGYRVTMERYHAKHPPEPGDPLNDPDKLDDCAIPGVKDQWIAVATAMLAETRTAARTNRQMAALAKWGRERLEDRLDAFVKDAGAPHPMDMPVPRLEPEPPIPWAEFRQDLRKQHIDQAVREIMLRWQATPDSWVRAFHEHSSLLGESGVNACRMCSPFIASIRARFAELAG